MHQEKYCKEQISENNLDYKDTLRLSMKQLEAKMTEFVQKQNRELMFRMQRETDKRVVELMKDHLKVPELIGDFCPYPDFSSFMGQFHKNTSQTLSEQRIKVTQLDNQFKGIEVISR